MTTTAAQITAERRANYKAIDLKDIINDRKNLIDLSNQLFRRLDCYEYSEENLEFLSSPHQIALEEELSQEEIDSVWDEIAASLQLTPDWCLEARINHTLSMGDRFHTFTQLLPRLSGLHKEKFKVVALALAPANQVDKYLDLLESFCKSDQPTQNT